MPLNGSKLVLLFWVSAFNHNKLSDHRDLKYLYGEVFSERCLSSNQAGSSC